MRQGGEGFAVETEEGVGKVPAKASLGEKKASETTVKERRNFRV